MKHPITTLILGLVLSTMAIAPVAVQANDSQSYVKQDKQAIAAELGKILTDTQKAKLKEGVKQGKEVKDVLPTLDLSPQQKIQVLKLMKSAKTETK